VTGVQTCALPLLEDLEEAPQMILTVADPEGRIVRRLTGRTSSGVTRVSWDLRYPSTNPISSGGGGGGFGGFSRGGGAGPYVVPGTSTGAQMGGAAGGGRA